jgi:uncharacterized protein YcnI
VIRRTLIALAGLLAFAAPASAHIQVRPALVAPGDPVLFQVIVPGERDARTVEVTLQVPKDVLPFSFEASPGWTRTNNEGSDGSIETITWKGELAEDGFARFSFLASTPEQAGEIVWKAIQTYDDKSVVRWIGEPDSENPAAVTTVSESAPRENAGGEGAESGDAAPAASATPTASAAAPSPASAEDDGDSPLPLLLASIALVAALAALVLAFSGRTGRRSAGRS